MFSILSIVLLVYSHHRYLYIMSVATIDSFVALIESFHIID